MATCYRMSFPAAEITKSSERFSFATAAANLWNCNIGRWFLSLWISIEEKCLSSYSHLRKGERKAEATASVAFSCVFSCSTVLFSRLESHTDSSRHSPAMLRCRSTHRRIRGAARRSRATPCPPDPSPNIVTAIADILSNIRASCPQQVAMANDLSWASSLYCRV